MSELLLLAALLLGIVVLTPLADRLRTPLPVLLTLYGLLLPAVPGVPELRLQPDLILPVVLPPLLFAATQRATFRQFREQARGILLLAVGLTVASAGLVALIAHAAGLPWGPAWVLGAVVAPPDPVAATAVARRLRLPHRLVTVLEGEGMFNDATALIMYATAVSAVVSGHVTVLGVGGRLVVALVVGVGVGAGLAASTRWALARLHLAGPETTVTVVAPFAAYLVAEHLQGSGVLAVLTLGLLLRSYGHPALTAGGWLLGRAVWHYADYLITSLVFVLIGFELTAVLKDSPLDRDQLVLAVIVIGALVVLRLSWVFPATWFAKLAPHLPDEAAGPAGWRETLVAGWAGMRGVVTVATALALPVSAEAADAFSHRDTLVVIALLTVLVTLVVQGLTLAPLVRALGVGQPSRVGDEVAQLRRRAAAAALDEVRNVSEGDVPGRVQAAAVAQYEGIIAAQDALDRARRPALRGQARDDVEDAGGEPEEEADDNEQLNRLLRRAAEVERSLVLEARRRGQVSAEAADEVLADVEARAVRDIG